MSDDSSEVYPDLDELTPEIRSVLQPFVISPGLFLKILSNFEMAVLRGLAQEELLSSPIQMLPTFVTDTPSGRENGKYFAIDLGGTNLRVLSLDIQRKVIQKETKSYKIPIKVMRGTGEQLFDFIATCVEDGLIAANARNSFIENMGVTFSFALKQKSLSSGILLRWSKGFDIKDVIGQDVGYLLLRAFQKRKLNIEKIVLINDTTGTLMSAAFYDADVYIGVIVGTGTNACYMENISNIREYSNNRQYPNTVIVNTEWGAFGEEGELDDVITEIDRKIDQRSINPGCQIFEKLISGMYVGEILREIVLQLIEKKALFGGVYPEKIHQRDVFNGQVLSDACDKPRFLNYMKDCIDVDLTDSDYDILYAACIAVSFRSAQLTAAGLITLMNRIHRAKITIAGDGSLFKKHPMFAPYLNNIISSHLPHNLFKIVLSNDGSGIGAALTAAAQFAEKEEEEYQSYADKYQFNYE